MNQLIFGIYRRQTQETIKNCLAKVQSDAIFILMDGIQIQNNNRMKSVSTTTVKRTVKWYQDSILYLAYRTALKLLFLSRKLAFYYVLVSDPVRCP